MTKADAFNDGWCECCGEGNATVVPAPSGGWMSACKPCKVYSWQQHAIDIRSYRF